jgi:hypothetical protein
MIFCLERFAGHDGCSGKSAHGTTTLCNRPDAEESRRTGERDYDNLGIGGSLQHCRI